MVEDQRIVLTRENIYDELNQKLNFGDILILLVIICFTYFAVGIFQPVKTLLRILLTIFYIVSIIITIREYLIKKDGKFEITEDKIVSVAKKRFDIEARATRLGERYIVTFESFGPALIPIKDLGRYSIGDKYCLVAIKPFSKKKLIRFYSLNKYNYVGIKKH